MNESMVEDAALEWFGELGYSRLGAGTLTPALPKGRGSRVLTWRWWGVCARRSGG
jgi:hypothetical protein